MGRRRLLPRDRASRTGRTGRFPRTGVVALGQHDALATAARQLEAGEFLAAFLDDALATAARQLEAGEFLSAFLDDIYVVTSPSRARDQLDAVTATIEREAGVAANLGKTRVYHARGGPPPPGIRELGEEVWRGDKPPAERGFAGLGVPIGHQEFIRSCASNRLEEERRLLAQLPQLPDLQCAWLLLLFCAAPRAQHLLRTVPPAAIAEYARAHDDEVWRTLQDMLGGQTADAKPAQRQARDIAFLPSLGAWASCMPSAFVLQPTGQHGRAQCQCCNNGAQQAGSQAAAPSLQAAAAAGVHPDGHGWDNGLAGKRVYEQRRRKQRAASPACGQMVGKGMLLSHSTLLSESRFCCRPFGPATVRCCVPRQVHMQGHG